MRVVLKIEYRGTRYAGWQRQPNRRTVQGEIEAAIRSATGAGVTLHASGRTDAGVHALGQVAHFDTTAPIPVQRFPEILNRLLPPDIGIVSAVETAETFHARKSAIGKTYVYQIIVSPVRTAIEWDTAYQIRYPLNPEAMNAAAQSILGRRDFASFCSTGSTASTTVRTLTELSVTVVRGKTDPDGFVRVGELAIRASADGFLYNLVRVLAAQLIEIGQGRKKVTDMADMLLKRDRSCAKEAAPPNGLYLESVRYGSEFCGVFSG